MRIQGGPESLVVGTEVGAPAMFMSSLSGGGCGALSETQVGEGARGGLGLQGLCGGGGGERRKGSQPSKHLKHLPESRS